MKMLSVVGVTIKSSPVVEKEGLELSSVVLLPKTMPVVDVEPKKPLIYMPVVDVT